MKQFYKAERAGENIIQRRSGRNCQLWSCRSGFMTMSTVGKKWIHKLKFYDINLKWHMHRNKFMRHDKWTLVNLVVAPLLTNFSSRTWSKSRSGKYPQTYHLVRGFRFTPQFYLATSYRVNGKWGNERRCSGGMI